MELNLMEIKEKDILSFYQRSTQLLKSNTFQIAIEQQIQNNDLNRRSLHKTFIPGMSSNLNIKNQSFSIFNHILSIDAEDDIQSPIENHILRVLRRGISIFFTIAKQYDKNSGLVNLKNKNSNRTILEIEKIELMEKEEASTISALFSFASYINFTLQNYEKEFENIDIEAVVEDFLETRNQNDGLSSVMFEYFSLLQNVSNDKQLVKITKDYFLELPKRITDIAKHKKYLNFFTNYNFKIENEDFILNGFEIPKNRKIEKIVMNFKKPEEVIGNHIAKAQALRLSKMLMAYDFKEKKNPFVEIGGFNFTFLGDGKPGTGKTTLIQMMAGVIQDYCNVAQYPFRYENFSIDEIDSYQGKSGQNIKGMIERIIDPNVIGFGTIDDIDQIAGKRGDRQTSAGQQEVTAVLMESFSGANTIVRGNATFGMFSNFPQNVDDALRQRAGLRMLIDGPQTEEDYIDIFNLLIGENHSIPFGKHNFYLNQQIQKMVAKKYDEYKKPQEDIILSVYENTTKEIGRLNDLTKIGIYLKKIQEADSRFTGRAIKNITDSIKARSMDFEMPEEWFINPEIFLWKDYESKKNMIKELMIEITPEIAIQEINMYADSEARYLRT